MQGPGRSDIANAGSGETRYSECRVLGLVTLSSWPYRKVAHALLQVGLAQTSVSCKLQLSCNS
ncbi:unnamed protein product, partial [Staurois parvus]